MYAKQVRKKKSRMNSFSLTLTTIYQPSAPMPASLTPLSAINCRALLTLAILCTLILPLFSAGGTLSPEMISRRRRRLMPSEKSLLISWIWTPTFLKWELHQAVNVCAYMYCVWKHIDMHARICVYVCICVHGTCACVLSQEFEWKEGKSSTTWLDAN